MNQPDLRTVTAHEQGMTIGSDDGTHGIEASGGIGANCGFVSWARARRGARAPAPPKDEVKLSKSNRVSGPVWDVRSRCVGLVNREKVVAAQLINRVCWSPPYSDMGTKQPFMKNGEVIFPKRPEGKARPTRVSRTV